MLRIGDTIATRYTIEQLLGQGGMGAVYLAQDNQLDNHVAIKVLTLKPDDSHLRFKREFRLMSRLKHPYILQVHSSGVHEHLPYLVMEYLQGGTLENKFSAAVQDKDDLLERLRFLHEVSEALSYVHSQGIIHRDLKPDNVMIADNHARLMDFGLAKSNLGNTAQLTQVGAVMGTATYMSPEQAKGIQVDARSDLYALGCLIYWLISYAPPFSGNSFMEVLMRHLRDTPPSLLELNPLTPPSLARMAERLLEKAPEDRYSAADDVSCELASLSKSLKTNQPIQAITHVTVINTEAVIDDVTPAALLNPPMIGRQAELAKLKHSLISASIFKLEAQQGLGMSSVLAELRREAAHQQHYTVHLSFNQYGSLPYGAWRSALVALRNYNEGFFSEASQGIEEPLMPLLAPNLSMEDASMLLDQQVPDDLARLRFYDAVDVLLTRYAALHPLLLIAEDMHLADEASVGLLSYLLRGQVASKVSFVLSHVTGKLEPDLKQTLKSVQSQSIVLEPFDESTMLEYISALLGGDIEPRLENYVKDRADGSPLFAKEILNGLLKAGHIKRRAGLWEWSRQHTRLPQGIEGVFGERVDALERETQKALQAASTIGRRFDFDSLMELTGNDEDDLLDAIDEALRAKLIDEVGMDVYSFVHPLLRDLLHSKLNPRRRRNYHQTLGDKLAADKGEPDCIADHYAETKDPSQALPYALKAAHRALNVFANDISETYYRLALQVMPEEYSNRAKVQLELGQLLDRIGKWDEAQTLYAEAQTTERHKGFATYLLGTLARKRGDLQVAEGLLREAMVLTPENTKIHSDLALIYGAQGKFEEAEKVLFSGLSLEMFKENAQGIVELQSNLGKLEDERGNYDKAIEWFNSALTHNSTTQNKNLQARILQFQGLSNYRKGKFQKALSNLEQAYELSLETGNLRQNVAILINQGLVFSDTGKSDEALIAYEKAQLQAFRLGDTMQKAFALVNASVVLSNQQKYEQAINNLQQAEEILSLSHSHMQLVRVKSILAQTYLNNNQIEKAHVSICEAKDILKISPQSELELAVKNDEARISLSKHQSLEAERSLSETVEQHQGAGYKLILLDSYLLLSLSALANNHSDNFKGYISISHELTSELDDDVAKLQISYLEAIFSQDEEKVANIESQLLTTTEQSFVKYAHLALKH